MASAAGPVGARILITSPNFIDALDGPLAPDFTLTNLIPPGYLAAGSLTFESDGGSVYWRLSWGGAAYTGPNNGACANDDSPCPNGDFGPPWPMALPSTSEQALQFQAPFNAVSTTNADDYEVTVRAATFFNNWHRSSIKRRQTEVREQAVRTRCGIDAAFGQHGQRPQPLYLPLPAEPRQALLAGEQFLHGALFELALLDEELLQGFDEGIRIAQRLGDGFLLGFGRRCAQPGAPWWAST